MSITNRITELVVAGRLTAFKPESRYPPKRRLYLAEAARKDYEDPSSAVNSLVGRGFIRSAMTRWTLGQRVFGNKKRGLFLDRLDPPPPEIWEIRVTEPTVQARLLGRFAEPDTLVLTKFYTRGLLGNKGSAGWVDAMTQCERTWKDLFGDELFVGKNIHDYVTENCDDFPI